MIKNDIGLLKISFVHVLKGWYATRVHNNLLKIKVNVSEDHANTTATLFLPPNFFLISYAN